MRELWQLRVSRVELEISLCEYERKSDVGSRDTWVFQHITTLLCMCNGIAHIQHDQCDSVYTVYPLTMYSKVEVKKMQESSRYLEPDLTTATLITGNLSESATYHQLDSRL